jgi:hypothetical protein
MEEMASIGDMRYTQIKGMEQATYSRWRGGRQM